MPNITFHEGLYEDENGNRAYTAHFPSPEMARKSLFSLINCSNCCDCTNCVGCEYCTSCSSCVDCKVCVGISGCGGGAGLSAGDSAG